MTQRPLLLDLFCGAGGAAWGYYKAGFDVVGVDIYDQPHYPFEFIQADAMTFPLSRFDVIHASPPCQAFTRKVSTWGRGGKDRVPIKHPRLIGATRRRLMQTGKPWVIENVEGAPLVRPVMYCGTAFDLRLIKHRIFEANWKLPPSPKPCDHSDVYDPWHGKGRTTTELRDVQETLWIPAGGGASRKTRRTGDVMNAIPPAYTEYIGRAWLETL